MAGLGVGLLLRLLGEREEAEEDDERARGPRFTGLGDLDTDLETDRRVGLVRGGGVGDLGTGDFFGDFFMFAVPRICFSHPIYMFLNHFFNNFSTFF